MKNLSFEILRSGTADEFDILSESQLEDIKGGFYYCHQGFSFDGNGKPVCGCQYFYIPDPDPDPGTGPVVPVGPEKPE